MKKTLLIGLAILLSGCSNAHLEQAKASACERWKEVGYECIGYQGYQWGFWFGGKYGGAKVWHTLSRKENPTVIYSGFVQFWGDELHTYETRAVDAISNK